MFMDSDSKKDQRMEGQIKKGVIMKYPRGSEWRKWDLHFHTPSSFDYDDKSVTDEDIISTLKQNEIAVVVITDHHVINVTQINNLRKLSGEDLTVLAGIELRSELGGSESIHFIGIFPEDSSQFNLETAWTKLQGQFNLTPDEVKKKGNAKVYCDLVDACKLIHESGGIVTIHAGSKSNSIEEITNTLSHKMAQKDDVTKSIDIFEMGKVDDLDDYRKIVFSAIKRIYPMVICSDNHNIRNYKLKTNCWIKADPTFEGLKQVLHEPDDRIIVNDVLPQFKSDAHVIDRIEIKKSNHWFEEKDILLNENMVAVIGEKGAGKTALVDFIGIAGGDFHWEPHDYSSFVSKALKSTKQIEGTINGTEVVIHWKNGNEDAITIDDDLSKYRDLKKVRYLSQSFIEKKCRPENADELQREIETIIFQHIPPPEKMGHTTFEDLRKARSESINIKKSDAQKKIRVLNNELCGIEKAIASLSVKKKERDTLIKENIDFKNKKPKPTSGEEEKIEKKLETLTSRRDEINVTLATSSARINSLDTLKTKVTSLSKYVADEIRIINTEMDDLELKPLKGKIIFVVPDNFVEEIDAEKNRTKQGIKLLQGDTKNKEKKTDTSKLDEITKESISNFTLQETTSLIQKLEDGSSIAEAVRQTINAFNESILANKKRIITLGNEIRDIEDNKSQLLRRRIEKRNSVYNDFFKILCKERKMLETLYEELKSKLSSNKGVTERDLEFYARIKFNLSDFCSNADKIIDFGRTGRYFQSRDSLHKDLKSIADKIEFQGDIDIASLIQFFYKSFENGDGKVKISDQLLKSCGKIDFLKWIFDVSVFSVDYGIRYKGTNIELLSPGKKGVVLLLMHLAFDTESRVPLIIDQPEENLDNKSLYPYLVNYFRATKTKRQIIIVSHNPNLVLNTDAEQIIVANFDAVPTDVSARISYLSGAIENTHISPLLKNPLLKQGIREHSADILEGGKKAFIKRLDKWGFQW